MLLHLLTLVRRLGVVIREGDKAAQGQQAQRVLNLLALFRQKGK